MNDGEAVEMLRWFHAHGEGPPFHEALGRVLRLAARAERAERERDEARAACVGFAQAGRFFRHLVPESVLEALPESQNDEYARHASVLSELISPGQPFLDRLAALEWVAQVGLELTRSFGDDFAPLRNALAALPAKPDAAKDDVSDNQRT